MSDPGRTVVIVHEWHRRGQSWGYNTVLSDVVTKTFRIKCVIASARESLEDGGRGASDTWDESK